MIFNEKKENTVLYDGGMDEYKSTMQKLVAAQEQQDNPNQENVPLTGGIDAD